MYEYKTELLESGVKWGLNDSASPEELKILDELLNKRQEEGWELATYSYMTNAFGPKSAFSITFRRKK